MNTTNHTNAGRIPGLAHKPFNQGADARHRGDPLNRNPFPPGTRQGLWWENGWREVEQHWGKRAKWPIRQIPLVLPDLDEAEAA